MCVWCVCVCVYSRLQQVCVLSLRCAVLPVAQVVGQHGVHQLMHLLLLPAAEQLWIHLEQTADAQLPSTKASLPPHWLLRLISS